MKHQHQDVRKDQVVPPPVVVSDVTWPLPRHRHRDQRTSSVATPPPRHCADACTPELLADRGNAMEPETGREFFLDFPCDLAPDEKVVFILSIHGAGSIGNWQRHYFPALDYVHKYRLVIATPTAAGSGAIGAGAPVRMWTSETDDAYLQNIVKLVVERFGRDKIRSFWLAGHSQGGMTSNRIVCTDFFKSKVDVGSVCREDASDAPRWLPISSARTDPPRRSRRAVRIRRGPASPSCRTAISHTSSPRASTRSSRCLKARRFADKYRVRPQGAARRRRGHDEGLRVRVDAGPRRELGREARPGIAEVFVYPRCSGGKVRCGRPQDR